MSTQTKPFLIGLFFLVGIAIAIAALIYLGASHWFKEKKTYATYFDFSVQGLNLDAAVKFRGVQVGRVSNITVAPDGRLIEVVMELDPVVDVSDSLRAGLQLTGITGLRYIELDYAGLEEQWMHPELNFESPYPVIPSAPGGFEEIEQALRDVYAKLMAIDTEGISARAKDFLDSGTIMMTTADSLMRDRTLTAWAARLDETVADADSMIKCLDMAGYDKKINRTLSEIHSGAKDFKETVAKIESHADSLQINAQIAQTFDKLNILITTSTEMVSRFNYESSQVMTSVSATLAALNETISELNSLVVSMESYPSNVFYAAPPEREE